jgi:hypothetical protein
MLATAGWTYQASGAGTGQSYNATGKVFTNTGSGSTGWSNTGAWARMQDPGGGRELVFQHNNSAAVRIKYSSSARFIAGSPANNITPSATDEVYLWGAGPDATPSYGNNWFWNAPNVPYIGGGNTVTFLGAAKDTAPYGFWFASQNLGTVNGHTPNWFSTLMMDPVTSVPEDPDPVVFHISDQSGFAGSLNVDGSTNSSTAWDRPSGGTNVGVFGYMNAAKTRFIGLGLSQYVSGVAQQQGDGSGTLVPWPSSSSGTPSGNAWLAANSFSGKQDMLPFFYHREQNNNTELPGIKGWSTMCRLSSLIAPYRETAASKAWINLGALWLPWDGVTTPFQ